MTNSDLGQKVDLFSQLSWLLSYKYRQLLIAILILLILILSIFVYFKYSSMQRDLNAIKAFELIPVLKLNKDLNVGDAISSNDIAIAGVFRHEYDKLSKKTLDTDLRESVLFRCKNTQDLSSCPSVLGRVLKIPVFKASLIREEMLAKEGIEPGIVNLLGENEAFVDLNVPQTGFNVFLKPNDLVDIYSIDKNNSKLLASKARIILVNALALGKAPMQVKVDPSLSRNITLALPKEKLSQVTRAIRGKNIYLTLNNPRELLSKKKISNGKGVRKAKSKNFFQSLTLIQGNKKEIIR